MTLKSRSFWAMGQSFGVYVFEKAGDELVIHHHEEGDHLSICAVGELEAFNEDGPTARQKPLDPPFLFRAFKRHGVRAMVDGTVMLNVMPKMGYPAGHDAGGEAQPAPKKT